MAGGSPSLAGRSKLQAECARAVRDSEAAADWLLLNVRCLVDSLEKVNSGASAEIAEFTDHDRQVTTRIVGELTEAVEQRIRHISTFNITLFGRSGSGKSSIMSALTHGDCSEISPGVSDHTTEVVSVVSGSLRISDVPGTEGWGRTVGAAKLRQTALTALASSDLVLLCFDTQNQRQAEFDTVAEWIAEFGKPVVAVLNVRNAEWRFPPRTPTREGRRQASRTVREHVDAISQRLAGIGLAGTPVIALSSKDAAFARVLGHYAGHDPEGFQARRAQAGSPQQLFTWSNLGALETLIIKAIRAYAVELRLSALYRQVTTAAERAEDEYAGLGAHLTELSEQAELGVQRVLAILGAPENLTGSGEAAGQPAFAAVLGEIHQLEYLRGASLPAPVRGSALRYADERITACIGPLRISALKRAEQLIDGALAEGRKVAAQDFAAKVFKTQELENAADRVLGDFARFLQERIGQVAADVCADVKCVSERPVKVQGARGRAQHWTGTGTSAIGIGAGLFGFAIANFWNPFGWTLFATGFAYVLSGLALDVIGKWFRKRAAAQRERELGRARSEARRSVNQAFDQLMTDLHAALVTAAQHALVAQLGSAVRRAIGLRERGAMQEQRRELLASFVQRVPTAAGPQAVLRQAAVACEQAARAVRAPADLWLGESWIRQKGEVPALIREPVTWTRDDVAERVWASLTAATCAPGAGRAWLARNRKTLSRDSGAAVTVEQLNRLAGDSLPRIVFCGDYDAGKTSLIARLHREAGMTVPDTLDAGGGPTTGQVLSYPWCGYLLVDTPGFQSSHAQHAALARAAAADAAVLVYLFTPTGISGDLRDMRAVLSGVKTARVLLAISHAEEMGVDPQDSPRAFAALCALKESELRDALRRTVDPSVRWPPVVSFSPKPYGKALTPAPWDGIPEFVRALNRFQGKLSAQAADAAILGGAIYRLTILATRAETAAAALRPGIEQLIKLRREELAGQAEAQALADERRMALQRIIADFLEELIGRALSTRNQGTRNAIVHRMANFTSDKELAGLTEEWEHATRDKVTSLIHDTNASLDRRRSAASFAAVSSARNPPKTLELSELRGSGKPVRTVGSIASRGARVFAKLEKFATEGLLTTKIIRGAGPVFAVVGGAISAWDTLDDVRNRGRNERTRAEQIDRLHRTGRDLAEELCDQEPALLTLREHCSELAALARVTGADLAKKEKELAGLETRIRLYYEAVDDAARSAVGEDI